MSIVQVSRLRSLAPAQSSWSYEAQQAQQKHCKFLMFKFLQSKLCKNNLSWVRADPSAYWTGREGWWVLSWYLQKFLLSRLGRQGWRSCYVLLKSASFTLLSKTRNAGSPPRHIGLHTCQTFLGKKHSSCLADTTQIRTTVGTTVASGKEFASRAAFLQVCKKVMGWPGWITLLQC